MKFAKIALLVFAPALLVFACTRTETPKTDSNKSANNISDTKTGPANSETPDELASSRKIYTDNCVKCHKEDGTGGEVEILGKTLKAKNLTTDKMKKEPDDEYIEHITDGVPEEGMPSFNDKLTDEEIKDVVRYIRGELQKS